MIDISAGMAADSGETGKMRMIATTPAVRAALLSVLAGAACLLLAPYHGWITA